MKIKAAKHVLETLSVPRLDPPLAVDLEA